MLRHRVGIAVICFTLHGILAAASSAVDIGSAFAVEVYPPIEPKEELGESPLKEPPFVTPQGLDRWFSQKALAAFDPTVPKPDDIVPIAEPSKLRIATDRLRSVTAEATVITAFAGLNQLSLPENDALPPDTTLAKSGFRVIEAVNRSLRLSLNSGATVQTKSLQSFFGALPQEGVMFDPRVIFDDSGANLRFYVVAAQADFASKSNLFLAVSRSSNPPDLDAANWCIYKMDGRRDVGTPLESFADYPMLGIGADTLVLSTNQGDFDQFEFTFAVVRAFNKTVLANNASSCPAATAFVRQPTSNSNDLNYYSLQPVQHYSPHPSSGSDFVNPVYLINTLSPPSTVYRVWAIRNVASGAPVMSFVDAVGGYQYSNPADAPQLGSDVLLDTNNVRIRQAVGLNNQIWPVHTTNCNSGELPNESCYRFLKITVTPGTATSPHTVTINRQRTLGAGPNQHVWMPGIAVNSSLQTAIALQHSSASSYLSALWSVKNDADINYPPLSTLAAGDCARTQFAGQPPFAFVRTGDYVGAQTNPNDDVSFWLAGERALLQGGNCRYDTQIIHVTP
jgi:hypothetical protein